LAISQEKKEQLVAGYVEQLHNSEAIIVTSYRGLKVSQLQQLRARIREANGSYAVVKNTLAQRALEEVGLSLSEDMLTGPIGIGFCYNNITDVAKAIIDFAKQNELLLIKGGLIGKNVVNEAAVRDLANLPPLEVLRARLLGVINAPASQLTGVLAGGVRQLVNVFNAYSEKESDAPAEA
jgi:large subunit ribosomal protein L10